MSSSAAPYNITIDRGSDWSKVLTLSDNNGNPVAITNIFTVAISITGTTSPSVAAASLTYVSADLWTSNGNATAPGSGTWIRVRRSGGAWEITRWVNAVQATGYWTSSSNPNHPAWVETWVAVAGATGSPVVDSAGMFFEGSISLQERGPDVIPFSFDTIGDGSAGQVEISLSRSYTRALANSGAYRFDWFVYHGRERIRLVAGRISAQGSSTGTSTGIPIPAFGSSPSVAWGNITGTLSNQTDLQAALSGKQPLDADLTAIAALTTTANGRALLTSARALTIGVSASVSGTNTGDQDLSGLLPRLSSITVTGTTPAFPGPLVEQPSLVNGKRWWLGPPGSYLQFDSDVWNLYYFDGVDDYSAYSISTTTDEPWEIPSGDWIIDRGTGAPVLTIDPPVLLPVNASGTIALSTDQQGRVAPADMTGLGTGVSTALGLAANATNGFPTANGAGRTALGSGATGDQLFTAGSPAAANTILANNVVTKAADFTLAEADAGTYMRLTKTGSTQTLTLPTSGISTGAEFQFYRATTQSLAFAGSATVNGTANLASVPNNGAFALKHLGSGTYDFI